MYYICVIHFYRTSVLLLVTAALVRSIPGSINQDGNGVWVANVPCM